MNTMELCNYLEKVRIGRKMTQEALLHGIVSIRQYQRYKNGDGDIPYEKLEMFAERLGIQSKKLLFEFEKEKHAQLKQINELYNAVANSDQEAFNQLKKIIDVNLIIEEETKQLYNHAIILDNYLNRKLSKEDVFKENAALINYPEILKHEFITDIEALIMSSLLDYIEVDKQSQLLNRLSQMFETESGIIMSSDNPITYNLIIRRLIKAYGMQKNYTKVLKLSDIGIKKGKVFRQYYLWDTFYFYRASAYFELQDFLNFEQEMFKLYNVLHMEGNHQKIDKFYRWVEKDFGVNLEMFVFKYIQKKVR